MATTIRFLKYIRYYMLQDILTCIFLGRCNFPMFKEKRE